jgi:hypothetical protein
LVSGTIFIRRWAHQSLRACAVRKGLYSISIRRWAHPPPTAGDRAIRLYLLSGKPGKRIPLLSLARKKKNGVSHHFMAYIDQNPVKAGLARSIGEWKASGAYHIRHNLPGLVDYTGLSRLSYISLLPAP